MTWGWNVDEEQDNVISNTENMWETAWEMVGRVMGDILLSYGRIFDLYRKGT